ncbi:cation:proton antiporter [Nitrososphaera viennensis]|uniref:Monovalent cation/proton antiporter-2 family protein n=2 Tax=Nitrososphaera viennensis TaxID=1034015 RepID=A0A060HLQ1_9ARCH|nr:cation:proton antiporter [Nitrososphaera viennensis]AIC16155.1 monovalent cation/proton antiporter-2 family protein [Nitrososphaera viennensis EN76]UVS68115.1 cation:proton antiporter [Nitrososphaera viennensis]
MAAEAAQVIQDFAIVMVIASVMALVFYKIKQPMVIGYIAAGMLIGPYTPPFSLVSHPEVVNLLAEIGIVLLLFVVGLEYPIAKLRSVGKKALVIAMTEAFGTLALGYVVGQAMGLALFDSLFLALSISVTSTVIVMRVLEELGMLQDKASILLLGVAVIEDIIIVSILAVLQSVASTGSLSIQEIGISVGLVLAFIGGALFIGSKTVPKFVDLVGKTNHHDLVIVAVLGVAFGLSFIANEIGISVAAGAFFAGVLVAESKSHAVARVLSMPLRDMFAALFFVSVGALMDISLLPLFIVPAMILIATSFGAKFTTVYFSAKMLRTDKKTSMKAGFALSASGGELALVTAKGGADVGATSSFILPMVGTMTIITTFLSPYVIKFGWKLAGSLKQQEKKEEEKEEEKKDDLPSS